MYAKLIEPVSTSCGGIEEKPPACWFYGRFPEGGICVFIGQGPISPN